MTFAVVCFIWGGEGVVNMDAREDKIANALRKEAQRIADKLIAEIPADDPSRDAKIYDYRRRLETYEPIMNSRAAPAGRFQAGQAVYVLDPFVVISVERNGDLRCKRLTGGKKVYVFKQSDVTRPVDAENA